MYYVLVTNVEVNYYYVYTYTSEMMTSYYKVKFQG